jgi:glycosyltransferase involved in cell wall biosynthesis
MSLPSVAVVVAVRDGERYLAETLDSILAQHPAPDDVVVVDDGSEDGTLEVLRRAPVGVRVLRQGRRGLGSALNRGISSTDADVVGFCDADDLWTLGKLAYQLAALADDPTVDGVGGLVEQFASPDLPDISNRVRVDTTPIAAPLLAALLVRRATLASLGGFDEQIDNPNIDWISRARTSGYRFATVDHVVLRRRIHDANWSLINAEKSRASLLRVARHDRERRLRVD